MQTYRTIFAKCQNLLLDNINSMKWYCINNKWKSMAFLTLSYVLLDYGKRVFGRVVNRRSYPPGPIGLPIFGSLITYFLDKYFQANIAKKYGEIVLVYLLNFPVVFISSSAIAKEVFRNKSTFNRKPSHMLEMDDGTQALLFVHGQRMIYRRRLVHSSLTALCATNYISEVLNACMLETVFPYLENSVISRNNHEWENSGNILTFLAFNTLYFANFGHSIKMNDPLYETIMKLIEDLTKNIPYNLLQDRLPWIAYLYPLLVPRVLQTRLQRAQIIRKLIDERNNEMKSCNSINKTSYIDNSSIEVQEKRLTESEQLSDTFLLFAAGVETVSSTLEFAVALLANNIQIQNKVRKELKNVFTEKNGKYTMFHSSKLNKLVLFRALVYETLRIATVLRRAGNAFLSGDIWISIAENEPKMRLPAGSKVINSIECINRLSTNEKWLNIKIGDEVESGLQLCLENWIQTDVETGQMTFVMNPSFLAFGTGKKNCVGQMLAMKELNIIIANLLLNFRFRMDEENAMIFENESSKHITFGLHQMHPSVKLIVERV